MIQTIDTLITYGLIAVLMLAGVLASAVYEHYAKGSQNDRTRN